MSEGFTQTGLPCVDQEGCGSSDALAINHDGWGTCFSCNKRFPPSKIGGDYTPPEGGNMKKSIPLIPMADIRHAPLKARGITEDTTQFWKYGVATHNGETVQVATYYDENKRPVAQKLRTKDKKFKILGDINKVTLYGQHLWKGGGKKVVVVEGEIDALSLSQVQNLKWPVVSIPTGAAGGKKFVSKAIGWLDSFEEIIFMFDQDEPGLEAASKCAQLLPYGKAKIARMELKDANEMLQAGKVKELLDAIFQAKEYTPESVSSVGDLMDLALMKPEMGLSFPWPSLTELTYGINTKHAYYLGAGTGIGKTNWSSELQAWLVKEHKVPIGVFHLEEAPGRTVKGIAGKNVGIPFHKPDVDFKQEQLIDAVNQIDGKVFVYRHDLAGTTWDEVKPAIIHMVEGQGVKHIFLDNLTVLVAHLSATEANEAINKISKDIAHMIQKHDFALFGFSHLNPPKTGAPHERGGKVTENQFTGSRGLMRFGQYMFGIERNKDPEISEEERNTSYFVMLKDRDFGNVGRFPILYDKETDAYREPPPGWVAAFDDEDDAPTFDNNDF